MVNGGDPPKKCGKSGVMLLSYVPVPLPGILIGAEDDRGCSQLTRTARRVNGEGVPVTTVFS